MDKDTVGIILLVINLIALSYFFIGGYIKISEQTSTKLSLTFRPKLRIFIGIFISQIVFLLLLDTFSFNPIHRIVCEHDIQNISTSNLDLNTKQKYIPTNCKITDFNLFNREKYSKLISNLIEAKIKQRIKIDKHKQEHVSYKIFLLTQTESIPFAENVYMDYEIEEIKLLASSINEFLINNEENKIVDILDYRLWSYIIFGCTLFFIGIILLLTSTGLFIKFCFDKETNLVTVSRYRCFGIFGRKVFQYSLNEIVEIKNKRITLSSDEYGSQVILEVSDNKFHLNPIGMISKHIDGEYFVITIKRFLEQKSN